MAVLMREAIGGSLRRARTERRRTLRDVSRRARVSLGYLSEVERGRKEPSSELLAAICDALDISLPDVLRRGRRGRSPGRWPPTAPRSLTARPAPDRAAGTWICGSAGTRAPIGRAVAPTPAPRGPDAGARRTAPLPERMSSRARPGSPRHRPPDRSPISSHLGWKSGPHRCHDGVAQHGDALGGRSRWPTASRRPGSTSWRCSRRRSTSTPTPRCRSSRPSRTRSASTRRCRSRPPP